MGSDPIARPLLNWLAREGREQVEVMAVYTQPDRAAGRGQKVAANAIKRWAKAQGIPVRQPERITAEVQAQLAAESPDVTLVMAYGHILREAFISLPRLGTLNLHASILPKYRGASPIPSAIANRERETGVTLMRMVRELDAGPVADCERVPVTARDTAEDVTSRLATACVPLVERNFIALTQTTLAFAEQDHRSATYCRKLVKADGRLDLAAPAPVLAARINGLYPWPGCRIELGGKMVQLGLAEAVSGKAPPGQVLEMAADALVIGAGSGLVRLLQLQRPGGRMLPAAAFLRGFPVKPGTLISSATMTELVVSAL